MISVQQLEQYEQSGYIIFEQLFNAEEMDRIRAMIDEFDEASEQELRKRGQDGIRIAGRINFTTHLNFKHPELQRFIADPRFVAITTALIGPDIKLYWDQSVYKRPEADRDFPWHQDNGYGPIEPQHYLTCWLALEDATIQNGCVWIQPGTHKLGLVEHVQTNTGRVCYQGVDPGMPVELQKGSMVAFHSLLFHRSTPNLSNGTRKAYVIQFSADGAINPETGVVFRNGPVIAKGGQPVYNGFVPQNEC